MLSVAIATGSIIPFTPRGSKSFPAVPWSMPIHGSVENRVTEIGHKLPGKALTFSGIGIYRRELFEDLVPVHAPLAPILREAMGRNGVTGEHHCGRWIDVGTPQRLSELDAELSRVE